MLSAVAEAVYHMGWERNPNVVKLACFAPIIQNANFWRKRTYTRRTELCSSADKLGHTAYLLKFDADPDNTHVSTSFYQEQMFNLHHGTETLPITSKDGDFDPLFWQASIDTGRNEIYLKVVNAGDSPQVLNVQLDTAYSGVNGTTMHDDGNTEGDIDLERLRTGLAIVPTPIPGLERLPAQQDTFGNFSWTVPSWSVNVIQFSLLEDNHLQTT